MLGFILHSSEIEEHEHIVTQQKAAVDFKMVHGVSKDTVQTMNITS